MKSRRSLVTLVLGLLAWWTWTGSVVGQSFSVSRPKPGEYLLQLTSPPAERYAFQASEDFRLWIDLQEDVQNRFSHRLTSTPGNLRFFRAVSRAEPPPPIRVVLIGDSTASDCCGWGQGLYGYFKPYAQYINYAVAWNSTKVFLRSAERDNLLLVKPDYVFVQFGYMETEPLELGRGTTIPEFTANLKVIVESILAYGGKPIMITPLSSRTWLPTGKVRPAFQEQCVVVREVAGLYKLPLIDQNQMSEDWFNARGKDGSKFTEFQPGDAVHSSPQGAVIFARMVALHLPPELGPYLQGILDPPPLP